MRSTSNALYAFGLRVAAAVLIVLVTYNPTGYLSYVHWLQSPGGELSVKVLAGIALGIVYIVLLRATYFSIGVLGAALVSAFVAGIVWVMVDLGILSLEQSGIVEWIVLIGIGLVLGVGLSWAIIRRQISGQVSVDDVQTEE